MLLIVPFRMAIAAIGCFMTAKRLDFLENGELGQLLCFSILLVFEDKMAQIGFNQAAEFGGNWPESVDSLVDWRDYPPPRHTWKSWCQSVEYP